MRVSFIVQSHAIMLRVVPGESSAYYRMRSTPTIGWESGGRIGVIIKLCVVLQYITIIVLVRPGSR